MDLTQLTAIILLIYVGVAILANKLYTYGNYDPNSGKISIKKKTPGVNAATILLHEQRHAMQNQMGWLNLESTLATMSWIFIIIFCFFFYNPITSIIIWFALIPACFMLFLEADAWAYSWKHKGLK